jgi:hypothetical protein
MEHILYFVWVVFANCPPFARSYAFTSSSIPYERGFCQGKEGILERKTGHFENRASKQKSLSHRGSNFLYKISASYVPPIGHGLLFCTI